VSKGTLDRRIGALQATVRRLLPASAPDPSDPEVILSYLTCEELARLETAIEGGDDQALAAAWNDAQRRAVARILTGVDVKALEHRELCERVLVEVERPPAPGRTAMVAFVPDMTHTDLWHAEAVYRGVLPRTMTTAELAGHDPMPWPPGVRT
jgi:hypothetical protein